MDITVSRQCARQVGGAVSVVPNPGDMNIYIEYIERLHIVIEISNDPNVATISLLLGCYAISIHPVDLNLLSGAQST